MTEERSERKGAVSFFWPVILIGAGVIALLVNAGHLPAERLWALLNLWPLLLILAGIDLLFARRLPAIGALVALGLIAAVIWFLLQGVWLGWGRKIS